MYKELILTNIFGKMKLIVGILLIAFAAFVCCDSDIESSSGESSVPANGQELPQNEEGDN